MTGAPDTNSGELLALLDWYRAAGVTDALSEAPIDRLAPKIPAPRQPLPAVPVRSNRETGGESAMLPDAGTIEAARNLAAAAQNLQELESALAGFDGCPLRWRATQLVFADGNPESDVVLVGEAPGRDEDIQGKPFVGRSGQLLDRILKAIGLDRGKVYIVNTVPWRPPGNRVPSPAELAVCRPFLERQIELVAPRIIVALGGASAKHLFNTDIGILRLRGQWREIEIGRHRAMAMATLHPAYLLRQPAQKKLVWRDMLALKNRLAQ
jgi:DNA polymerase